MAVVRKSLRAIRALPFSAGFCHPNGEIGLGGAMRQLKPPVYSYFVIAVTALA
jgi:hypothetical protein